MRSGMVCGKLGGVGGLFLLATACTLGGQEGEDFKDSAPMAGTGSSTASTGSGTGAGTGTGTGSSGTTTGTQPLDGDSCVDVLATSSGTEALDTANLANDYDRYLCGTDVYTGDGTTGRDAVLSLDVPGGSYLAVAQDAAHDGLIAAYTTCEPTDAEACVGLDDAPGSGFEGFEYQNDTDQQQTVFVFTDGYGASDSGPVDVHLQVYDPATGGDSCATAVALDGTAARAAGGASLAYSYSGFTDQLSFAAAGCVGSTATGEDVVFSLVLDAADTLDVTVRSVQSSSNAALYVVEGDCTDLDAQCAAGSDGAGAGADESVLGYSPAADNTTVFIVVDGATGGAGAGVFVLDVVVQ